MRLNSEGCLGDDCGETILSTGEINNTVPSITLFPNPSTGVFHFKKYVSFDHIFITDVSRKMIHQLEKFSGKSLDLSLLVNGKYFLQFYKDNELDGVGQVVIAK